jgi:hypothetical protein
MSSAPTMSERMEAVARKYGLDQPRVTPAQTIDRLRVALLPFAFLPKDTPPPPGVPLEAWSEALTNAKAACIAAPAPELVGR